MKSDYEYIYIYIHIYTHTYMSNEQDMGPNQSIKITNQSTENMLEFGYLGMTLKHQNCRKDVSKSGLIWENAFYD
jgi:hypothetical protein